MVFQSKKPGEDNQVLPGGGLEVDLDRRMCPECHRETPPWEARCKDCGVDTVPPEQAPALEFRLPHLEEGLDDEDHEEGGHGEPEEDGA
jgi:hypothetical protein